MAACLRRLAGDSALRDRLRERAAARVAEQFTADRFARDVVDAWESLVQRMPRRSS